MPLYSSGHFLTLMIPPLHEVLVTCSDTCDILTALTFIRDGVYRIQGLLAGLVYIRQSKAAPSSVISLHVDAPVTFDTCCGC